MVQNPNITPIVHLSSIYCKMANTSLLPIPCFEHRSGILYFYHPFNFVRELRAQLLIEHICTELASWVDRGSDTTTLDGVYFYWRWLPWDTNFFGIKTAKLHYVLYEKMDFSRLAEICNRYLLHMRNEGAEYLFIEIPPEDIFLIQALNIAGMKSTETRLIYFNDAVQAFEHERYLVRQATPADIPTLREVAATMRNNYDRFHADPAISVELGDAFLAKYVEEGVKGYNDVVLLPNEPGVASNAFFTANLMRDTWQQYDRRISKIVLTAASSLTNKGWHYKLLVETTYWLQAQGTEVVYMPTQSTNRAVIRNCEKLGYRYGGSFHVLTARL